MSTITIKFKNARVTAKLLKEQRIRHTPFLKLARNTYQCQIEVKDNSYVTWLILSNMDNLIIDSS